MTSPQQPLVTEPPGARPIVVASPVPGLDITREPGVRECWAVVHAASGKAVICDLAGLATAEWAALDLGDLGIKWTLSAAQLANAADLLCSVEPGAERIAVRHGGVTLGEVAVYVP